MQKANYRPDIEGLRAFAILAVIACHANIPYLQGGFVGVDIFFVLSGYLITGLLVKEINATGKVSLLSFYARRFKRLLPGLALMLLVTSIVASLVLTPLQQAMQTAPALSAILWISNFQFIYADAGYFDPININVFLHTWSLSVEEQFYIAWPLLILLFMRGKILQWLTVVFMVSLAWSLYLSYTSPLWGFYSMPTRGWQFALGGITCLLATNGLPSKYYSAGAHRRAGVAGLILIFGSVFLIMENSSYPGVAALFPSIGAALLLFAQSEMLAAKPLQAIGKVSYSWYLWHWPVLVIGNQVLPAQGLLFQMALVALSLLIAIAAYRWVEMPFRNNPQLLRFPVKTVLASMLIMVSGAMLADSWRLQLNETYRFAFNRSQRIRSDIPAVYAMGCDQEVISAALNPCNFGDESAPRIAVLFADSVGTQWFSALEEKYTVSGWRLLVLVKSGCPIVDAPIFDKRAGGEYVVCASWRNLALEYLAELHPDVVFIGSSARYDITQEQWASGTQSVLQQLSPSAGKVLIIKATPRISFDVADCLDVDRDPLMICENRQAAEPDNAILAALQHASAEFNNVKILDFNDLVCTGGTCPALRGGVPVYRDNTHITDTFVKSISNQVGEIIDRAQ